MASTPTGAALTTAHRAQQLAVQAGSIENLVLLWRAVDVTRLGDTIDVFAQAAALLAARGFDDSARSSANYYSLFRRAEIGAGLAVPLTSRPPLAALASDIRGAALSGILRARRAGMDIARASDRGLVRAVGALGKLVLSGGRMTIVDAVKTDRRALGWMRATAGSPCPFCRMLAGRGAVYKSEKSADFESHDYCGCGAEPLYADDDTTLGAAGRGEQFAKEWQDAQAWARSSGTMSKGTSNDALSNYRRYLAAGEPTAGNAGTEDSGQ